jgi:GxxExxY protein
MERFLYKDETYAIHGAIFEVYRVLGCGFLEAVYQMALEVELAQRNIPFASQVDIDIEYKGMKLEQTYRADLVCYDKIILELKSVQNLLPEHEAQLQNYLRATKMRVGLLVNFGHYPKIEIKRIAI